MPLNWQRFAMEYPEKGCGCTDAELILYEVSLSGARPLTNGSSLGTRPLDTGSKHLFCGYRPESKGFHSYGIFLCPDCAATLGFPVLYGYR
jgi:hypothetical protein